MRADSDVNQTKQVKKRIALYWILLVLMFLYIFVAGEMGLGDSRKMSELADVVSRVIIFGGIIFLIAQIVHNRKLLKDANRMQIEFQSKQSEREKLLYCHCFEDSSICDLQQKVLEYVPSISAQVWITTS